MLQIWLATFEERQHFRAGNIWGKTTFQRRQDNISEEATQHFRADNIWGKTTFQSRQHLRKTTFQSRQHFRENFQEHKRINFISFFSCWISEHKSKILFWFLLFDKSQTFVFNISCIKTFVPNKNALYFHVFLELFLLYVNLQYYVIHFNNLSLGKLLKDCFVLAMKYLYNYKILIINYP